MNKQELIEGIEAVPAHNTRTRPWIDKKIVLGLIRQLDEPEKVVIPKFVAEWYEEHKDSLELSIFDYVYRIDEKEDSVFKKWFVDSTTRPFQILVNMHQFGYEVEKEKRYIVKVKGLGHEFRILKYNIFYNDWFTGSERGDSSFRLHHTRKELEDVGFGEVFNSPLFEVEEVE